MHKNLTNPNEHKIKIVFVGDCGVGKSSIISCYARQEFNF
jgi:GTPase SAR1 family protein